MGIVNPETKICPLMSTVYTHVEDTGGIVGVANTGGKAVQLIASQTPCIGDKCALWNSRAGGCGLVTPTIEIQKIEKHLDDLAASTARLANNAGHLANLEPPKDGKSPIMRLADAVENLVKVNLDKKAAKS